MATSSCPMFRAWILDGSGLGFQGNLLQGDLGNLLGVHVHEAVGRGKHALQERPLAGLVVLGGRREGEICVFVV